MMWLLFGTGAILTAELNLICFLRKRECKWFRYASLSLTALTVCAIYCLDAGWVAAEDWSALMDVVPTMSKYLWMLVPCSILLNGITLFSK